MRKSNTQPLGEVIHEYLKAMDINNKLKEVRFFDSWPDIVGIAIAKKTTKMLIKNRVLFIYMNSSVARSELLHLRQGLVKALNDRAGEKMIDEIVIR
jgi:predicted nucleic acid-binding Zn ribbon protein